MSAKRGSIAGYLKPQISGIFIHHRRNLRTPPPDHAGTFSNKSLVNPARLPERCRMGSASLGGTGLSKFHTMSSIIPLISSGTAGPLGVLHLPRLWLKVSLGAAGRLHPDYPAIGHGYDQMVIDGLGLDRSEFESFIAENKPTYPELEAWILEKSGGALDAAAVKKLNDAILGYHHNQETRTEILSSCGIPDDGSLPDAINLNNLDDWLSFHKQVIA